MKNSTINIIFIIVVMAIMAITNPTLEKQKELLVIKLNSESGNIKKQLEGEKPESALDQMANELGQYFLQPEFIQKLVDNNLTRDNYILFSLPRFTILNKTKIIGIGIFNDVFWFEDEKLKETNESITKTETKENEPKWKLDLMNPTSESIEVVIIDENSKNRINKVIPFSRFNRFGLYSNNDVEEFYKSSSYSTGIENELNTFNKNRFKINDYSKIAYYSDGYRENDPSLPIKFELINNSICISIMMHYEIYDENLEAWLSKNKQFDYDNFFEDTDAINFIRKISNNDRITLHNVELWKQIFKIDIKNLSQAKINPL